MDKQIILPNTGNYQNDCNSDTLYNAFRKVNYSICVLSERLGVEVEKLDFEKHKDIYNTLEDVRPDFEIINRNLKKLDKAAKPNSEFEYWLEDHKFIPHWGDYEKNGIIYKDYEIFTMYLKDVFDEE